MNVIYLKYAVAVAKAGSLNKAAEELFVVQPNLSRAIKELEKELGTVIFERTSKGISLTPDGEKLIGYGKKIIREIEEVEAEFHNKTGKIKTFAVSVPHSGYISEAFSRFLDGFGGERCRVTVKETDNHTVIEDVINKDCTIGVVRYPSQADKQAKEAFDGKKLSHELVAEFGLRLVAAADGELAKTTDITAEKLEGLIRAEFIGEVNPPFISGEKFFGEAKKTIYFTDRASLFSALSTTKNACAFIEPTATATLEKYGLKEFTFAGGAHRFRDVLIYPSDYCLSKTDKDFITALCIVKRELSI